MSRYRLLVLATRHAIPPDSGYATDVYCSVTELVKQDVEVRILLVDDGKAPRTDYPASLLAGVVPLPRGQRFTSLARAVVAGRSYAACKWALPEVVDRACRLRKTWPFDLVQASGSFHMENALAIKRQCGVKVAMRAQNVEHEICQRMAGALPPGLRRSLWQREAAHLREAEAQWCRAADVCLAISEADRSALQSLAPETAMFTVQAGANVQANGPMSNDSAQTPCFLHVGSLDWAPRLEGLLWFLREVWPLARSLIPGVRLVVAGSASESTRAQFHPWRDQGVSVHGFVDDLAALARGCTAMVVPMRCGGGIKIRVITAWASGWPVVGTTRMGEGLPAQHAVNCLMADEPAALAAILEKVATDQALRQRIIRAGLEVSRTHFSWEAIGRSLRVAHESCLEAR